MYIKDKNESAVSMFGNSSPPLEAGFLRSPAYWQKRVRLPSTLQNCLDKIKNMKKLKCWSDMLCSLYKSQGFLSTFYCSALLIHTIHRGHHPTTLLTISNLSKMVSRVELNVKPFCLQLSFVFRIRPVRKAQPGHIVILFAVYWFSEMLKKRIGIIEVNYICSYCKQYKMCQA